jgi:hypothetical protein
VKWGGPDTGFQVEYMELSGTASLARERRLYRRLYRHDPYEGPQLCVRRAVVTWTVAGYARTSAELAELGVPAALIAEIEEGA